MHKCIRVFKSLGSQGNTTVKSMDQGEIKMVKHITNPDHKAFLKNHDH